jgi:tellurite resistance protein TehA-like permease
MAKTRNELSHPTSPALIAVRNFASQWFLVAQGTGIIGVILHQLDYQFDGLIIISEIFWVLTIVLLVVMLIVYGLRIVLYPKEVAEVLSTDANETACLASISITFTSIIQMMALNLVQDWGKGWGIACFVLWWINTAMAAIVCIGIPYVFVKYEPPGVNALSPAAQLPLIAALTAAAGGGVICNYGALSAQLQVPVIIVSYLLIGMALPLSLGFDTLFLTRLFDRSSPSGMKVFQEMIVCGPWGQGSFALQSLGQAVMKGAFASYAKGSFLTSTAATPVGFASIFAGLCAWGHGTFWWAFAVVSIAQTAYTKGGGIRGLDFSLAAWSLVFPWVCVLYIFPSTNWLCELTYSFRVSTPMLLFSWANCWIRLRFRCGQLV